MLPVAGQLLSAFTVYYASGQVALPPPLHMVPNGWGTSLDDLQYTVLGSLALVLIVGNMTALMCAMALVAWLSSRQLREVARGRSRRGS